MRGRKPTPSHVKKLLGNPGKRPINGHEPKPKLELPSCPSHLMPTAKAEWKRIVQELYDLGIISRLDRAILAAYCQAYGRWAEAEKMLKETPVILKMPSGYIQQNPWLTISTKQMELVNKFASELGMTPSSRSRVEVIYRPKQNSSGISQYFNCQPSRRFSNMSKPWETEKDEFFD